MADGPVCGAGLFRLSLRGAIARGFICVHGLFVTYEYHSPSSSAGSEGAKGAEGDGLVGVVERLGPDDLLAGWLRAPFRNETAILHAPDDPPSKVLGWYKRRGT